jgi:WD40 repeat protein
MVADVAFSPGGTRIATASRDETARIWDAASGAAVTTMTGHFEGAQDVAFSPSGALLATASSDATARFAEVRRLPPDARSSRGE